MTIIKHNIKNIRKWDFDGSHTAYDAVSQINDQYKYDDKCKIYTYLSTGNNNQSKNEVDFLRNTEKKEKEMKLCVF